MEEIIEMAAPIIKVNIIAEYFDMAVSVFLILCAVVMLLRRK